MKFYEVRDVRIDGTIIQQRVVSEDIDMSDIQDELMAYPTDYWHKGTWEHEIRELPDGTWQNLDIV